MKVSTRLFIGFVLLMIFASCEEKTHEVLVYNLDIKDNRLVLDNDTLYLDDKSAFSRFNLTEGEHIFFSYSTDTVKVNVTESGLVSLSETQFVSFPITFSAEDALPTISALSSGPMIIENSIVVYDKMENQDALVKSMVSFMNRKVIGGSSKKSKITPSLRILPVSDGLIKTSWHFPYDEIPESVEIKESSFTQFGFKETKRKVLMELNHFLYFTKQSGLFKIEKIENEELIKTTEEFFNYEF